MTDLTDLGEVIDPAETEGEILKDIRKKVNSINKSLNKILEVLEKIAENGSRGG